MAATSNVACRSIYRASILLATDGHLAIVHTTGNVHGLAFTRAVNK